MDQRSIYLFLATKRLSAQAIYNELVAVLGPEETPPEMARDTIQDRKIVVTIAWNPLGFPLIAALPKGRTFNAKYDRDNILAALTELQPEDDGKNSLFMLTIQELTLLKNVEFFAKRMDCGRSPLPYSPDLAQSNFFLFGYVMERLKGMVFPSYEELLDAIGEVVTDIESETLTVVFEHWMERLE
jgi:hypothetical protein